MMFKRFRTIFLLSIITLKLFGQSNFNVEGKEYPLGLFSKTYAFSFRFKDSLNIYLLDSTIRYSNPQNLITKRIYYSCDKINKHEPTTTISYLRNNRTDSISKTYNGEILSHIYETKYDSLDRIIYYGRKDFKDSTNGFEWYYEYRDSILNSKGRINIQTIYCDSKLGNGKKFHFMVLSEYDKKNRKIKETRQDKTNDPMACITIYKYNRSDSLISQKTWGRESISKKKKKNTKCNKVVEMEFEISDSQSIKSIVHNMILTNKESLINKKCNYFIAKYISKNENKELIIFINRAHYSPIQEVTFTVINNNK